MTRSNVWMSVSDLMTGLMVIFMFVAIAYIMRVQKNQTVLKDFVENKQNLHARLVEEFRNEAADSIVTISGDLSLRFQRAESLFDDGSWELRTEFRSVLAEILPKYLGVLLTDSLRYKIREVRIEGHTNSVPYPSIDSDPYIANLILSQRRALSVIRFLRSLPQWKAYSTEERRLLEYWLTANGFSYGHALDTDGGYALATGRAIDQARSRRVELRIITSGEEILEHFIERTQ